MEGRVMRDAGSVLREGGQGVGRQGEVGDAGLHVYDEVEGRGAACRRAGRGGGGVVIWWWRLYVWHGCGLSEWPSDTRSAGTKICSLQRRRQSE